MQKSSMATAFRLHLHTATKMKQENKYQPADYTFFLFIQKFLKTIKQNYNCLTTFGTSSTTITRHDLEEL